MTVKQMGMRGQRKPADYTLVGVCLEMGYNHDPQAMIGTRWAHVVAAVRATNGKIVVIDNTTVGEYGSWAEIEALQYDPVPNAGRLLPSTWIYRLSNRYTFTDPDWPLLSNKTAQASPITAAQLRNGLPNQGFDTRDDLVQRQLGDHDHVARNLVDNFRNLSLGRNLDTYRQLIWSIQVKVDALVKNDAPEPIILNIIAPGQR